MNSSDDLRQAGNELNPTTTSRSARLVFDGYCGAGPWLARPLPWQPHLPQLEQLALDVSSCQLNISVTSPKVTPLAKTAAILSE